MKLLKEGPWFYFIEEANLTNAKNVGKWMLFFDFENQYDLYEHHCESVVSKGIVSESKISTFPKNGKSGVAIFYLDIDDLNTHKKIISYFLDNNMIPKTKNGRLHNLGFKLDRQTRSGEYGPDFEAELKMEDIVDLKTSEFKI